jgi:hypothetical protein
MEPVTAKTSAVEPAGVKTAPMESAGVEPSKSAPMPRLTDRAQQ